MGLKLLPVLPLSKGSRILVAGPLYNATEVLLGNYQGPACPGGGGDCLVSLQALIGTDWH